MSDSNVQAFRLSPEQTRVWALSRQGTLTSRVSIDLGRVVDASTLEGAMQDAVVAYEILRTTFKRPPGLKVPFQIIADTADAAIDVREVADDRFEEESEAAWASILTDPEWESGPLVRAIGVSSSTSTRVVLGAPAMSLDTGSLFVLADFLSRAIEARAAGGRLDEEPMQYVDFAEWHHELLEESAAPEAPPVEALPLPGRTAAASDGFAPRSEEWTLAADTVRAVASLAERLGASWDDVLAATWASLLGRSAGVDRLTIGEAVSGRGHESLTDAIGPLGRTIPVSVSFDPKTAFDDIVSSVAGGRADANEKQYGLLWDTDEEAPRVRAVFKATDARSEFGLRLVALEAYEDVFDVRLHVVASSDDEVRCRLSYDSTVFDDAVAAVLRERFEVLLGAALVDSTEAVSALRMVADEERVRLVEAFNDTDTDFGPPRPIHERFAATAQRCPDRVAVVYEDEQVTFGALDARSNAIARELRARGAGMESVVALYLDRSTDLVAAILGTMKVGAAYLPIDVSTPSARVGLLLQESGAGVVVTSSAHQMVVEEFPVASVELETVSSRAAFVQVSPDGEAAHTAYLIFTSGSTGVPKGVAVEQRQLSHYVSSIVATLGVSSEASFATVSTFAADLGHTSVFPPLATGGTLHIVPEWRLSDPDALAAYVASRRVECLKIVPSFFDVLLAGSRPAQAIPLERLILGGEASRPELVQKVRELSPATTVVNHYGPTETTVGALAFPLGADVAVPADVLPIGAPLPNARTYLLDGEGANVGAGMPGELYVGGLGVTRGYVGSPGATAERFLPDPWSTSGGERLYRTGDLAVQRLGGDVEFRGRADDQLKVRGYRVELGEIAAALRAVDGVADAIVVARGGGASPTLVGYVTTEDADVGGAGARAALGRSLPDYMVPDSVVVLEDFPLTKNGKIDRAALPDPEVAEVAAREIVAPRTELEGTISKIWMELLGVDEISVHDDFFALGGHSLMAMRLTLRIRQETDQEVPVHTLFEAPTIAGLAAALEEGVGVTGPRLTSVGRDRPLPLSFAQQRLWFLAELDPEDPSYNRPAALSVEGDLHLPALEAALTELVRRHEILRTTFPSEDGKPVQRIEEAGSAEVAFVDLTGAPDPEAAARQLATREAVRPFDLANGPMVRTTLIKTGAGEHVLLFTQHHIVTDAWSNAILIEELDTLYRAATGGTDDTPAPLPVQYADYAVWQREWLAGDELQRQVAYWTERLGRESGALELATDRTRPAFQSTAGARVDWSVERSIVDRLEAVSREQGATLFMTLFAAYQLLLHRYSGKSDIRTGSPIAGRAQSEVERLLGFFVNTIVLRTDFDGDPTFEELLDQVRRAVTEAQAHQDVPFEELVEVLQPDRSLSRTPLFETVFVFDPERPSRFSLGDLTASLIQTELDTAKFDLTLNLTESDEGISGALEYSTELFDESTARRVLRHYGVLLRQIAEDPSQALSDLSLLDEAERQDVVHDRNATMRAYPTELTIHEVFQRQVVGDPDRVALVSDGASLTYAGLDQVSNRLARYLTTRGVAPGDRVGLLLDRTPEIVSSVLAILKAGATYVPIDADYPQARIDAMVKDAGVEFVLTDSLSEGSVINSGGTPLVLDRIGSELVKMSAAPVPERATIDSPAYVIYTSGSTGEPKGVEVPHRGVLRLVFGTTFASLDDSVVVPHLSSPTFDASTLELWAPLLHGGRCVLHAERIPTTDDIDRLVHTHGVTTMWLTSSLFNAVIDERAEALTGVRDLLIGGEALSPSHVSRGLGALSGTRIVNGYGPTESTTFACCHPIDAVFASSSIPIGQPIGNTTVVITRPYGRPAPVGVPGELRIGGDGLALGYLGSPSLTASRFVPDPFSARAGSRMYRTGDRARQLESGTVEFLGRLDAQVKVRGFRIELGEIETVLLGHPGVGQAVAHVREDQPADKRLIAYYVEESEGAVEQGDLRAYLRSRLPEHMIPTAFMALETLPRTPNGKLDRRALPAPDSSRPQMAGVFTAPRTNVEEALARIWSEVLGLDRVGVFDDFFELGGHSLLATQLVSRIRAAFDTEIQLRQIFENPTVAGLAETLDVGGAGAPSAARIPRRSPGAEVPITASQGRLWFLDRLEQTSGSYNVSAGVRLEGPLRLSTLHAAIEAVVARHEALRTTFSVDRGKPRPVISEAPHFDFAVSDVSFLGDEAQSERVGHLMREESARPFDLERGPLLRVTIVRTGDLEHLVVLTVHHIVSDGWSLGVLVRELSALYSAFDSGTPPRLNELEVEFGDFAAWQSTLMASPEMGAQIEWWTDHLHGANTVLELPADRPRPTVQSFKGKTLSVELSDEANEAIRAIGRRQGTTPFMTLLASYALALGRYSGRDDLIVGVPIAGRHRPEIEELIGFFVNSLALRIDLRGDPTATVFLDRVRSTALGAFANQDVPLERLLDELDLERDPSRSPLFQVAFALQNAPLGALSLGQLELEPVEVSHETSKFDLTLNVSEGPDGFRGSVEFCTDLFVVSTIERFVGHVENGLLALHEHPDTPLSELPVLDRAERARRLEGWSGEQSDYPREESLGGLFSRVALARPDAVAIVEGASSVTYGELDRSSNRLARALKERGVGPETPVGVLLDRSVPFVTTVLAVTKAGGIYVPLDPSYPDERLAFMLRDAGVELVLSNRDFSSRAGSTDVMLVDAEPGAGYSAAPLPENHHPDRLAYVVYTSGSTGTPKGVAVPHAAVVRLVRGTDYVQLGAADVVSHQSNTSFDATTFELWGALLNGGRVVVVPNEVVLSPVAYVELLRRSGVTALFVTTALFNRIVLETADAFSSVGSVLFGGEATDVGAVDSVLDGGKPDFFANVYGPTENTTFSTFYPITSADRGADVIPIGRSIRNSSTFVLGTYGELLPNGAPGELLVGGDGLARGYHARPGLTAERFVPHPFATQPGERLYRTGDVTARNADGQIIFRGRADHQVKIRGFRIELGEIEAALVERSDIRSVVVLAREDRPGVKRLVGYVVPEGPAPSASELRRHLLESLPEFMVPGHWVVMDALPLTGNGKLDRAALPAPETARPELDTSYVAASGEFRSALASIWSEVLDVDSVGIHDNFFDLGGSSLLLVEMQARLVEWLGRDVPVVELFQFPTIDSLAAHLGAPASQAAAPAIVVESKVRDAEPIAVVGMAGRFPGADSVEAFWENLKNGVESIRTFSDEELAEAGIDPAVVADEAYVPAKGWLDGVGDFDADFFGYSAREAELTDPQQRLFLQCAWEALERAGYDARRYEGSIGVYAGSSVNHYTVGTSGRADLWSSGGGVQAALASDKDHLPTRVSYKLNLRGPSVNVQTACSTSLVAIHQACRSILDGECDMALAGGVSAKVPLVSGYYYRRDGIVSPDGRCRPFDEAATGTVPGSGVGIVVLKRLSDAIEDGDTIHGVIRGTAINNDGAVKVGYTAPSVEGQSDVIAKAHAAAGVRPEEIGYVEAHGTGTALGDPIEVAALTRVFGAKGDRSPIGLGSLKSNMGHLDAAAGVAGFIKAVLAVEHGEIPPSLHFETPSSHVDFDTAGFSVVGQLKKWESPGPRLAGVSSFGIGGTNAHAVVQSAPVEVDVREESSKRFHVLPLSARTGPALAALRARIAEHLESGSTPLADAAYTLQVGRREFGRRSAVVVGSAEAAVRTLASESASIASGQAPGAAPRVVFLFPGQGAQHAGMGQELYETEPVFRAVVDRCAVALEEHIGFDLRDALFPTDRGDEAMQRLTETAVTQPAVFVVELALAHLWMSWGVRPAAMVGHSIGEYVAACLSGVLSEADALRVVATRGRLMGSAERGSMVSVVLTPAEAEKYTTESVVLSVVNGPSACVLAGPTEDVDGVEAKLQEDGVTFRRLATSHAFHSPMMEPLVEPMTELMRSITIGEPRVPYASNVTGTWVTESDVRDPEYWARQMRGTVRFSDGIAAAVEGGDVLLLEVGPGQSLKALVRRQFDTRVIPVVTSLGSPRDDEAADLAVAKAVAELWCNGVTPDWAAYHGEDRRRRVVLPTYPFQVERYWVEPVAPGAVETTPQGRLPEGEWFYTPSWRRVPRVTGEQPDSSELRWLVFDDGDGEAWRKALGGEVVVVRPSDRFGGTLEDGFDVDPSQASGLDGLFSSLAEADWSPTDVLHIWSAGDARVGREERDRGYHAVVTLARWLGTKASSARLSVVTTGAHDATGVDRLVSDRVMTVGAVEVAAREYPELKLGHIDFLDGGAEQPHSEIVAEHLLGREAVVALRGVHRLVRSWDRVEVSDAAASPIASDPVGAVLITGGFGGVGAALAQGLARDGVGLILLSRSALPERDEWDAVLAGGEDRRTIRSIELVRALEAKGARVATVAGAVDDAEALRAAVEAGEAQVGPVKSVIHAAGIADGALIALRDREADESVLAAKVDGTKLLDELFADRDLDAFVLCSSLASIQTPAGQVAYVAGNAFMDAFAQERAVRAAGRSISINWDTWREGGMAVEALRERAQAIPGHVLDEALATAGVGTASSGDGWITRILEDGLSDEEGAEAFAAALALGLTQVAISTRDLASRAEVSGDWEATLAELLADADEGRKDHHARPELETEYVEPAGETEKVLAGLFEDSLGVRPIGRHDGFFDLHGDSLSATQLLTKIRARFGADLTLASFFAGPTVAELAAQLDASSDSGERVAELASRLKEMSPEEKAALLEKARKAKEGRE